jgi:rfaE bifunctional protein kinase chain/domain
MNENFLEIISNIQKKKILCIGDIILDNYISNEFIKISEEDPVNVIKRRKESFKLGGVGNVALNLKNFGINLDLITLGSKDEKFKIIKKLIKKNNINSKIFYFKNSRITIKERQYVNNYHLLRTDNEKYFKIQNNQIDIITNFIKKKIKSIKYDAILVSDYGKGLVSNLFFSNLSLIAKKNKIKIFVDPK